MNYCFTDRTGGISTGAFLSNNLATHVGDEQTTVLSNRARLESDLGIPIQFMNQVHGAAIASIGGEIVVEPIADALTTQSFGIGLAVMVADCIPLLLANSSSVAAVHVGRKGLMNEVAIRTVEKMHSIDPSEITAVVGPSICGQCYEVSEEIYDEVSHKFPLAASQTRERGFSLNLAGALIAQLQNLGVKVLDESACTVEESNLFSYRRDGVTGRQVGVIWL